MDKRRFHAAVAEVEQLMAFVFFGIAGTMGRAGLVQLTAFEQLGSVWPNFCGCFVMGFIPAIAGPILMPLFGVGFCGAMTSFSELITDIFNQSTTRASNWPDSGYGVPLFMARLLLELSCCFAAYLCGGHLARLYKWSEIGQLSRTSERGLRIVFALLGVAAWVVCIVTAIIYKHHRDWPLYGVYAPFGVWLRYYLSKLNGASWFKGGTFAANVFATLVACVVVVCNTFTGVTPLQSDMMLGVQRGFCGSLSTISTLVKEINALDTAHGYLYGIITLFAGYSLAFIIIGSYKWTVDYIH